MDPFILIPVLCTFVNLSCIFSALNVYKGRERDICVLVNSAVLLINVVYLFLVSGWMGFPILALVTAFSIIIQYFFLGGKEKAAEHSDKDDK